MTALLESHVPNLTWLGPSIWFKIDLGDALVKFLSEGKSALWELNLSFSLPVSGDWAYERPGSY